MKNTLKVLGILLALAALFAISTSVFILDETQQAIITQFGRPIGEPRTKPGMHWKVPFVQKVQFFDKRYLEWDGDANQVTTRDKKYIFIDAFARWEITDPLQFFIRLRDENSAQSRLDDILDGETRNAVASHDLLDIVRSTNREPEVSDEYMQEIEHLEDIKVGRERIESEVLQRANGRTRDLGIRILDFRFKRTNYVPEVSADVHTRMISERNRIADRFRSEGQGEALKIQGDRERDLAKIRSEAIMEAERIRGRADAEATAIYASAYDRDARSRELYSFLRSLEAMEKSLDEQTTVILTTESELFKFMKRMQ